MEGFFRSFERLVGSFVNWIGKSFLHLTETLLFVGALFVSAKFTIKFFLTNNTTPGDEWFWILVAIIFELAAVFCLIRAKTGWAKSKVPKLKNWSEIIIFGLLFIGAETYSIVSKVSYSLVELNKQNNITQEFNTPITTKEKKITELQTQIDSIIYQLKNVSSYSTNQTRVQWRADDLNSQLNSFRRDMKVLEGANNNSTITTNTAKVEKKVSNIEIFAVIGKPFHMNGEDTYAFLFYGRFIILSLILFVTAKPLKIKAEELSFIAMKRVELIKYVETLFNIKDNTKRLNTDKTISNDTDISMSDCKEFRRILLEEIGWNRTPAIYMSGKATLANFPKEAILTMVNNKAGLL